MLNSKKFTLDDLKPNTRIYFVGIGGISMYGLARLAKDAGFIVGGSDNHPSERTELLKSEGIKIYDKQLAKNLTDFKPDFLVKTAAILEKNREVKKAAKLGLQVLDRAEFLGAFTRTYKRIINVSGTHGKTTTTSMTSLMMIEAGADPTVHLGADLGVFDGSVRVGSKDRDLLVSEACEYNRSFLNFTSTTAIITNIDHDHVDIYPTIGKVIDVFAKFMNLCTDKAYVVITGHDLNTAKAVTKAKKAFEKAGRKFPTLITCARDSKICEATGKKADFIAKNIEFVNGYPHFDIVYKGTSLGRAKLLIPGSHNINNALNAAAAAYVNGASPEAIIKALNNFEGADGRFTIKGKYKGCDVVVDYAHHPSAATATIEAATNMPHNNILVVFQPLTYNRVHDLMDEYVEALKPCRKVLFSEIFTDRESSTMGVSSKDICDNINECGGHAEFYADKKALRRRIDELIEPGDIILILGPEDIRKLGDELCPKG